MPQANGRLGVEADLRTAIQSVWPECTMNIRNEEQARIDWAWLMQLSQEVLPLCVLHFPPSQEYEEGPMDALDYVVDVTLWYFAPDDQEVVDALSDKLTAMMLLLRSEPSPWQHCQVWEAFTADVTADSAPNAIFLEANMPILAGGVHAQVYYQEGLGAGL